MKPVRFVAVVDDVNVYSWLLSSLSDMVQAGRVIKVEIAPLRGEEG